MEVDSDLLWSMMVALRGCSRLIERGVRNHPLDHIDVGILALAEESAGELRPSSVVEQLDVPFPSVTRHVQRLQSEGLVSIQPSAEDRRSYQILATEDGRELLGQFRDSLVFRVRELVGDWDQAQVRALAEGLIRLEREMTAAARERRPRAGMSNWWRSTVSTDAVTSRKVK